MSSVQECRQCGEEVRSDLIDGLCPKCVARMALRFESIRSTGKEESETDAADDSGASEVDLAQPSKQVRRFGEDFGDFLIFHRVSSSRRCFLGDDRITHLLHEGLPHCVRPLMGKGAFTC